MAPGTPDRGDLPERSWHHRCLSGDPFLRLAVVGGADDPTDRARAARMLFAERLPEHAFDAAVRVKRILAARGFRDEATAFALHDMLARRAGNCLGLTLLRRSREQRPERDDQDDTPWRDHGPSRKT